MEVEGGVNLFFFSNSPFFFLLARQERPTTTAAERNNRLLHAMLPQAGGYAAFGGYGKLDDARGLK